jgi:U3 small nucleolar ribonucleoprotein protein IMP4
MQLITIGVLTALSSLLALAPAAKAADFTDIVAVQETRGEPDALIVSHLPFGPTVHFTLSGAVLRHDLAARGTVSEAFPHLIFANFATPLGARVRAILTALFPAPKPDARRGLTFSNDADFISFRHHVYDTAASARPGAPLDRRDIALTEIGPRFELHPYMIRLGTLDQDEAETEWALRSFTNTARKSATL